MLVARRRRRERIDGKNVANYPEGYRGKKSREPRRDSARMRRGAAGRNTSLVEKLNRTPGATPSSFASARTLLTYEQIKKLPASRKPASELASGSPLVRETISQRNSPLDIIFRACSPLPLRPLLTLCVNYMASFMLLNRRACNVLPHPPIQCLHEILRSTEFVGSTTCAS